MSTDLYQIKNYYIKYERIIEQMFNMESAIISNKI